MKLRHSLLPKLAACGQYDPKTGGEPSPAAARGTALDEAFRHAWTHSEFPNWDLPEEDAQAVRWAIDRCIELSGIGDGLRTEDKYCKVHTIEIPGHEGTADGVALGGCWSVDLKSGQFYDYQAQMAAYALGFMQENCESQWTTHLLFCDQRKVVTHKWTYESAQAVVKQVLDNIGTAPVENQYCGWCSKSLTCPARVDACGKAMQVGASLLPVQQDNGFLEMLNDPERLGLFLKRCLTLDDFREAAKAKARELIEAGTEVPGWKLQRPRITEFVEAEDIVSAVESGAIGAGNAIRMLGNLSAKKAQQLWSHSGVVLPESMINSKSSQPALVSAK
jgi:hypothetical protein